jgi:hypothetical protein
MATVVRRRRLRTTVLAMVLGTLAGLVLVMGAVWIFGRQKPSPLTAEALAAAQKRWDEHGPANYSLDVTIGGRQPGKVHLVVEHGAAAAMTRDGVTPRQRRTWKAWTVPGQFEMLEIELEAAADPQKGFGAPPGAQTIERATFDAVLGYPLKYERSVLGTPLEVGWEVHNFQPLPERSPDR